MSNINKDIERANFLIKPNKTIKELEKYYSSFFKSIYSFTTENLKGYYKYFDFKNKQYLTVIGSGDQTLNAILSGSRNIDCFDINPLAKYYQELKIEAIKELDYCEFITFFINKITKYKKNNKTFHQSLYKKINLKGDTKLFWDNIINSKNNIRNSQLFNQSDDTLQSVIKSNEYMNEENYKELKNILLNEKIDIKYYDMNLKDLPKLQNNYDIVNLSNIADYLDNVFSKKLLLNFKKVIENIKLNDDGIIILNYYYNFYDNSSYEDDIHSKSKIEKTFNMDNISYIEFDPTYEEKNIILKKLYKNNDYIMCYKNNKTL